MEENILTLKNNKEIAEQMKQDNFERFKALVRMHLSFELDLNTDEFDLPSHEVIYVDKGKVKKWNRLTRKIKSCASGGKSTSPFENNITILNKQLISQCRHLKEFILLEENIKQEGVFRRTGAISRQNELRSLINKNKDIVLTEGYTVHDCATVYKSYLSELPEPLLTDAHYPAHCQISEICKEIKESTCEIKEIHLLNSVQLLLLLLPEENRMLLEDIIDMLSTAVKYEKYNKMSPSSLATLFAPHLICPRNLPPEALHYVSQNMSNVISYMIVKGKEIFDLPSKLATDIRAYYLDQKRKKTMSPENTLDESISDISTVNTVYTFVDREKTAAAHTTNPTDTALAQLYAHIQSMPESSKKRKLIKQFNKENGQGTPLQLLMMDRIKSVGSNRSAKSISDSIKKHIFSRNIISRTPKRTTPTSSTFNTPNGASTNPKLRVLFQSPISCSPTVTTTTFISSIIDTNSSKKLHPLHKSISSSSLLNVTTSKLEVTTTISPVKTKSISAPVSRTSSDLSEPISTESGSIESTNLLDNDKISLLNVDDLEEDNISNKEETNTTELNDEYVEKNILKSDLHHNFKSEPNLSRIMDNSTLNETYIEKHDLLNNKMIKGISLRNIQLEATPNSKTIGFVLNSSIDDDGINNLSNYENTQHLNVYRNLDLITSTPSLLMHRRSMSPITKSTQRMPKAMQESIMTPRSRKPVMLATTIGSSEQNQTTFQSDLSNFREQDEESLVNSTRSPKSFGRSLYNTCNEEFSYIGNSQDREIIKSGECKNECGGGDDDGSSSLPPPETLTNTFREYLLSRSVLTTSPVDSSFSSQPDDFGSATDIQDLSESQMNSSLLYFLDGNQLNDENNLCRSTEEDEDIVNMYCDKNSVNITNYRKRAALRKDESDENKENYETDDITHSKKILIVEQNPRETSL